MHKLINVIDILSDKFSIYSQSSVNQIIIINNYGLLWDDFRLNLEKTENPTFHVLDS